jgi:electron transfer flavoprotein beta subunit
MKIIVCIKQVPGTSNVEMDPETGTLKRGNVEAKMNPFDLFALESAFRIREKAGGEVTAISMGPPAASSALLEAIYMGADKGVLLTDHRFAGADVVATSYALAQGIRSLGAFNLVICGKQTTDGDTAQVGPEIAEFLGIPHSTNIVELLSIEKDSILAKAALEAVLQVQQIRLPCLICVDKDLYTPRLPSYLRKKQMDKTVIRVLSIDDLEDKDPAHYGQAGSPTRVEEIFPPPVKSGQHIVEGRAEELSAELMQVLERMRLVK